MGAVISRWKKKPSTIELLERLDKEIDALEKVKRTNLESQKRVIGSLVLYSVLLYICGALLFYFFYLPVATTWAKQLLYSVPLLVFPLLVWGVKRFLHWYFVKRITKNESALEDLRDQKKTILEEVREKETYKKAKEILEKFDPESFKDLEPPAATPVPQRAPEGQEVRQRSVGAQGSPRHQIVGGNQSFSTPQPRQGAPGIRQQVPTPGPLSARPTHNGRQPIPGTPVVPPPGPPMPRPVLPRERSTMERFIEVLVGDGPQNRYALVCSQCFSHNGMALKEEFEYLSFRCCYCYHMNPARKQRPVAPRLQPSPPTPRRPPPQAHGGENRVEEAEKSEDSSPSTESASVVEDMEVDDLRAGQNDDESTAKTQDPAGKKEQKVAEESQERKD